MHERFQAPQAAQETRLIIGFDGDNAFVVQPDGEAAFPGDELVGFFADRAFITFQDQMTTVALDAHGGQSGAPVALSPVAEPILGLAGGEKEVFCLADISRRVSKAGVDSRISW
jgi:hypothetical protein